MTTERQYDEGLEEIWRIKRAIAAEYPTLDDYFKGMLEYREERKRSGVKLVSFSSGASDSQDEELGVAEGIPSYGTGVPAPSV